MVKTHLHRHHRRQADMEDAHFNVLEERKASSTAVTKVATLVSVVYVTAAPTFSGPVAGYTTIAPARSPTTPVAAPVATPTTDSIANMLSSALLATAAAPAISSDEAVSDTSAAMLAKSVAATSSPGSVGSSAATGASTASAAAASSTSTDSAIASPSSSPGMSAGTIAGVVIGILLALIALLALAGFLYRRKKCKESEAYQQTEDEKHNPFADAAAVPMSARVPPPQPLHPKPIANFNTETAGAMNNSQGTDLENAKSPLEPSTNPFAQPAQLSPSNHHGVPAPLRIVTPTPQDAAGAGATTGAAAATAAELHGTPKPLEIKRASSTTPQPFMGGAMPSPAGTEFSMTSMTPPTAAGGPPGPMNVHRIQLDFKPSMDDELELKAGQLVRLLHEYDDGWALCIRLDRSAQGVAPRTCLSARPVKPRSKPPGSPAPNMRMPVQRSTSPGPHGEGPQSASKGPASAGPRSNSAGNLAERRNTTPAGPSPLNMSIAQMTPPSIPATEAAASTPTTPRSSHGVQRKPVPGTTPTPST